MGEPSTPVMVDEAEGCSDDGESGSEGDELDEQLMEAIVSGNLPVSTETSIALNLVYQELLQAFMRHVEACLAQNREKQRTLEQELRSYSGEGGARKRESKVPTTLYLPPYFRDSAGIAPMKNADAISKSGELNVLVDPGKRWSETEKEKLLTAVVAAITQQETVPLTNKKHFLLDQMKCSSDPDELTSLSDQLQELEKKIAASESKVDVTSAPARAFETIDWNQISVSEFQGTRTPAECRLAWFNEVDPRINQSQTWSKSDCEKLIRIVKEHEFKDWKSIAAELQTGCTAFQCFEKYQSDLGRHLKSKWTPDEDAQLRDAVQRCRQGDYIPWEQVVEMIEGRSRAQCVTRWSRSLAPGLKRGKWTEEENLLLLAAVEKVGPKDWGKIAEYVPGRTDAQCRERWTTSMASGLKVGSWTEEEDSMLMDGIRQFGPGAWTKICHLLEGRTAGSCKVRYRVMQRRAAKLGSEASTSSDAQCIRQHSAGRSQRFMERKRRIADMYTRIVGHPPVLNTFVADAEKVLEQLPVEIRPLFREKLLAVKARNAVPTPMTPNKRKRRRKHITKRDPKESKKEALKEREDTTRGVRAAVKPVNKLAALVTSSRALLPPTAATLGALRNLLSWHGADWLVGMQQTQPRPADWGIRYEDIEERERCRRPAPSLTAKTTANLRSYMEERDDSRGTDANTAREGDVFSDGLLPNDGVAIKRFAELRDVCRQLFLWPAVLATFEEEENRESS